jgi:pimeloyl-ACP methyl ester carboxylesterase
VFGTVAVLALLQATAGGVRADPAPVTSVRGVVFAVDGVGGFQPLGATAHLVLPWVGVEHEIREFAWARSKGHLVRDVQDTERLLEKAAELSHEVLAVKAHEPGRPVYLVGHSAGTFIVLEAARALPPATLERIILLSPAVSPGYDLGPALCATRREIVSFNSKLDRLLLWWGTSHYGTADRVYGPAAGLDGFEMPSHDEPERERLYERLVQIPWQPHHLLEGRGGLHCSTWAPIFVARELARWLRGVPAPDSQGERVLEP